MKELTTSYRQNLSRGAALLVVLFCFLFTLTTIRQQQGFLEILNVEEFFLADGQVDFVVVKKVEVQHHQRTLSKCRHISFFTSSFFVSELPHVYTNILSFYTTHPMISNLPVLHRVFRI